MKRSLGALILELFYRFVIAQETNRIEDNYQKNKKNLEEKGLSEIPQNEEKMTIDNDFLKEEENDEIIELRDLGNQMEEEEEEEKEEGKDIEGIEEVPIKEEEELEENEENLEDNNNNLENLTPEDIEIEQKVYPDNPTNIETIQEEFPSPVNLFFVHFLVERVMDEIEQSYFSTKIWNIGFFGN